MVVETVQNKTFVMKYGIYCIVILHDGANSSLNTLSAMMRKTWCCVDVR